jgi:hypothetical protein
MTDSTRSVHHLKANRGSQYSRMINARVQQQNILGWLINLQTYYSILHVQTSPDGVTYVRVYFQLFYCFPAEKEKRS